MRLPRILILVVILLVVVLAVLFLFVLRSGVNIPFVTKLGTPAGGFTPSAGVGSNMVSGKYAFKDREGKDYLGRISWEGNYLLISGGLEKQDLLTDNSLTLRVATQKNSQGGLVQAFLPDGVDPEKYITTLRLKNGKYPLQEVWEAVNVKDLVRLLISGRQVTIYVDVDEKTSQDLINNVDQNVKASVRPISHIIVGVYE